MNDQELDELLNGWTVPAVPETLRASIQTARKPAKTIPVPVHWTRAVAVLVSALLLMFVGPRAFTQVRPFIFVPADAKFTVHSEHLNYNEDGSIAVRQYITAFQDDSGSVWNLSTTFPEEPFRTAVAQTGDWLRLAILPVARAFFAKAEEQHRRFFAGLVRRGCLIDHPRAISWKEKILGFETVANQIDEPGGGRETMWFAPRLSCFEMKDTFETKQRDGSFRVTSEDKALSVNWLPTSSQR